MAPVITNDIRQPACSTSQATIGADSAGPAKVPALKIAVAKPRSLAGNHCRTTLPQIGNEAASPTPSPSRAANMLANPTVAPVAIPPSDQSTMEIVPTLRLP